jgi:hypothetical protein
MVSSGPAPGDEIVKLNSLFSESAIGGKTNFIKDPSSRFIPLIVTVLANVPPESYKLKITSVLFFKFGFRIDKPIAVRLSVLTANF